jgi:hypothetical protein
VTGRVRHGQGSRKPGRSIVEAGDRRVDRHDSASDSRQQLRLYWVCLRTDGDGGNDFILQPAPNLLTPARLGQGPTLEQRGAKGGWFGQL